MIANFTDHSANERTLFARVRTAIAIMGFGMAAAKMIEDDATPTDTLLLFLVAALFMLLATFAMHVS